MCLVFNYLPRPMRPIISPKKLKHNRHSSLLTQQYWTELSNDSKNQFNSLNTCRNLMQFLKAGNGLTDLWKSLP